MKPSTLKSQCLSQNTALKEQSSSFGKMLRFSQILLMGERLDLARKPPHHLAGGEDLGRPESGRFHNIRCGLFTTAVLVQGEPQAKAVCGCCHPSWNPDRTFSFGPPFLVTNNPPEKLYFKFDSAYSKLHI